MNCGVYSILNGPMGWPGSTIKIYNNLAIRPWMAYNSIKAATPPLITDDSMTSIIKEYQPTEGIGQRLTEIQRIKLEIDRLTEQLDEHKAYLLGHAVRNNYDGLRCGALVASRRERASWVYSEALQDAESKLKGRKLREQKNGTAVNNPTEHLVINFSAKIALANTAIR